jgi:nickel/cobalt transporter (NicO) family protein
MPLKRIGAATTRTLVIALPLLWCARALAASPYGPFGAGLPDDGYSGLAAFPRLFLLAIEVQTYFNERLTSAIEALKHNGAAAWTLMAISFLYGVVHAIGPGHGKAVVSSYVLANRQTLRNGVLLAFLAALAQAAGAVTLILVATAALRLTSVAITVLTYQFEIGSDVLIILLGLWMVFDKVIVRLLRRGAPIPAPSSDPANRGSIVSRFEARPISTPADTPARRLWRRFARPSCAQAECDCNGLHMPNATAAATLGWSKAWSILATTALRPCTGALIVLVFARVEGVLTMGILAVFVMGLGVAITVSTLAILAAGLRGTAVALAGKKRPFAARLKTSLEIAASFAMLAAGLLMLAANLTIG